MYVKIKDLLHIFILSNSEFLPDKTKIGFEENKVLKNNIEKPSIHGNYPISVLHTIVHWNK